LGELGTPSERGSDRRTGTVDRRAQRDMAPPLLRLFSDWSWRLLVVAAAVGAVIWAAAQLSLIVGPVIIATMICALLEPIRLRLLSRGVRPGGAWMVAFAVGILCVSGVLALAVGQFYGSYDELAQQAQEGVGEVSDWLADGPMKINASGIEKAVDSTLTRLKSNPSDALSGTFSVLSTTGELVAGAILTLLCTLFFMKDRHKMWEAVLGLVPEGERSQVGRAGQRAWGQLVGYVKVTLTSAVVDSTVIGLACIIAGLPVAFALGALVFLFAFIPTVGAVFSGGVVVLVALVSEGTTTALILAAVVLVVQQLDANVMYPMLASRHLSLHPLASLLLVAAGGVVGGLFGAFIAVPAAAVLLAAARELLSDGEEVPLLVEIVAPVDPDGVDVSAEETS
jgi:predicted PurR-regulated permease PerM